MERYLKERLIGAAVLVAAAIILIPEMLSGPATAPTDSAAAVTVDGSAIKTYTIDLRHRDHPGGSAAMPPSEMPEVGSFADVAVTKPTDAATAEASADSVTVQPQTNSQTAAQTTVVKPTMAADLPEQAPPSSTAKPESQSTARPTQQAAADTAPAAPEPERAVKPVPTPAPTPVSPTSNDAGWAVQVASLGTRASAEKMAGDLKQDGFKSFVMPIAVKGKTLFRVRVGPVATRQAADALLIKVKRQYASAAVVPHP